ncbi:hypothetical protein [Rossellomorea sp. BNER]|uniref:hypothetical protein n=1 Tax=Rossellomorea sp. BNER TaxID=2962031 RepID=UPI003AF27A86|nr:hypothetical protein [Rossellomorea sp. BNER]
MINIKGYTLLNETVDFWMEVFIPDYELFFFKKENPINNRQLFRYVSKRSINLNSRTSFTTWKPNQFSQKIIKVTNHDFSKLDCNLKEKIITEQYSLGRGLIFNENDLEVLIKGLTPYHKRKCLEILSENRYQYNKNTNILHIRRPQWDQFTHEMKITFLSNYATWWIDEASSWEEIDIKIKQRFTINHPVTANVLNKFPEQSGPNCLAATASVVSNDLSKLYQWMEPNEFKETLNLFDYKQSNRLKWNQEDVLVWFNESDEIVHSAFAVDEKWAFNKQGQTMFHPWQLIEIDRVVQAWNNTSLKVYSNK